MKYGVLALDYDGTIARDGELDPDVKSAIAEARTQGIVVLLVTGRILADLKRVAEGIEFVGSVLRFQPTRSESIAGNYPELMATGDDGQRSRPPRRHQGIL